jgi:hypothetical protein
MVESRPPGHVADALVRIACRLLPAGRRDRYLEEFRSELFDLPRRYRLCHAGRLLWVAPAIRFREGLRERPSATRTDSTAT